MSSFIYKCYFKGKAYSLNTNQQSYLKGESTVIILVYLKSYLYVEGLL
jgi:hypothetical protein